MLIPECFEQILSLKCLSVSINNTVYRKVFFLSAAVKFLLKVVECPCLLVEERATTVSRCGLSIRLTYRSAIDIFLNLIRELMKCLFLHISLQIMLIHKLCSLIVYNMGSEIKLTSFICSAVEPTYLCVWEW